MSPGDCATWQGTIPVRIVDPDCGWLKGGYTRLSKTMYFVLTPRGQLVWVQKESLVPREDKS